MLNGEREIYYYVHQFGFERTVAGTSKYPINMRFLTWHFCAFIIGIGLCKDGAYV
ncbi:hypothetical protein EV586_101219 [Tumebacillus sp. BK434]|nr:hypothetical protein EV586_101219 [Tumebacillus sp. BK434]